MDDSDSNQKRKKLSVINPTNMTRKLFGKEWILTALCKGIQGRGFRIPGTAIQILCQWNLDSGFQTVAEFWIPITYSGFQSPGLRIPEGKHYPDSGFLKQKFPDSGIRILLHGANSLRTCLIPAQPFNSFLPFVILIFLLTSDGNKKVS